MALPKQNTWKVEIEGSWHEEDFSPPLRKLSDWALTWWVQCILGEYLDSAAIALMNMAYANFGLFSPEKWWGPEFYITSMKAIHITSGNFQENTTPYSVGTADTQWKALPYQAAVFAWANAKDVRKQTRHWFPGWNDQLILPDGRIDPKWNFNLDSFCSRWFKLFISGPYLWWPVIWDAEAEVAYDVHTIHRNTQFRTVRRRAVKAENEVRTL